jgi:hypothetical protein
MKSASLKLVLYEFRFQATKGSWVADVADECCNFDVWVALDHVKRHAPQRKGDMESIPTAKVTNRVMDHVVL